MNPQAQNSSRHAVRVASISLLLLGAEAFAAPPAVDSRCPSPTVGDPHGHCILPRDVVLDAPLDLASFTTLDCKGHTITPAHPDVLLPSAIVPVPSSDPQTAILVHDSVAVTIKNCVIEK